MPVFQGTMRLENDPDARLQSLLTLDEDRLILAASGQELGAWSVEDLSFTREGDDIRIEVEDQAVVFTTNYADRLTEAVGLAAPKQKARRSKRDRKKGEAPAPKPEKVKREPRFNLSDVPFKTRIVVGGGLVLLLTFVFLPTLLMTLLALVGTVGVLLGITAIMEPTVAARLPTQWPPQRVLIAGLTLMVVGLVVGIIR
ncbi:MAG: hypothetical protein ACE5MI_11540 [Acidimicrobiia bacterium]